MTGGATGLSLSTELIACELAREESATVGRDPSNDLVVDDPLVSRHHARVDFSGGAWTLHDLESRNGTFVDGERVDAVALTRSVLARLGHPENGPWLRLEPRSISGAAEPVAPVDLQGLGKVSAVLEVRGDRVRIGRDADNDVVLDELLVSRHHAEFRFGLGDEHTIVDLGSHNGTFVNGRRVDSAPVGPSDLVTIGAQRLLVRDGRLVAYADAGNVNFAADDLTVVSNSGLALLDGVSFALDASCFLGVVGPSGSGKSTLLGALTGYRPATRGRVYYGGRDLYAEYDALRRRIGFVPQDDLVQLDLTVEQSLRYAARLRFPPDVGSSERAARVDAVLEELGLTNRRGLRVRQLSGGQRKRVSVALELLTKPALLFLDEPTSGLDPGFERSVMQLLRGLADDGRIVVCVTHSVDSLFLCDRVLCLAPGGKPAYFGPPQLAPAQFGRTDWHEVFQDLSNEPDVDWKQRFEQTDAHARFVEQPMRRETSASSGPDPKPTRRARGWFRQTTALTARYARSMASDRRAFLYLTFAAPVLGLVLLLRLPTGELKSLPPGQLHLFSRAVAPLLLVALGLTQLSINLSVREIVKELAIFKRERAVGLSISAYLASKVGVLAVVGVVQAAVVVMIATARQGGPSGGVVLGSGRLELIVVFAVTSLAGMALGLLTSAIVRSEDRLALVLPAIIGFQALAATGIAIPSVPRVPVLDQASYAASASWGFTAAASTSGLNQLEAFNNALTKVPLGQIRTNPRAALNRAFQVFDPANPASARRLGDPAYNHDKSAWTRAIVALLAITAVCLIGAGIALRRYDPL